MRCSEIAAELNDLFASLGLLRFRSFGYGHSFGVLSHYYGREADLELREDVDTVLQPGMVVSMVIFIYELDHSKTKHSYIMVILTTSSHITTLPFLTT